MIICHPHEWSLCGEERKKWPEAQIYIFVCLGLLLIVYVAITITISITYSLRGLRPLDPSARRAQISLWALNALFPLVVKC